MTTPSLSEWPNRRSVTVIAILAAIFVAIPAWEMATYPPYVLGLQAPQMWQGGIEVLVVAALMALAQIIHHTALRAAVMALVAEFYLRRHAVDLPLAIDLLYVETLTGLGWTVLRCRANVPHRGSENYLSYFIAGVLAWSAGAWLLSACGVGSLMALRVYTGLVALLVLALRPPPLSIFIGRSMFALPRGARVVVALLFTWWLALFAHSSTAFGFDALWYGLRGQYVLVGEHSAFTSTGLVSAVYYFPKLYELLLIPVSALGNSTVIAGMSLFVWSLFALACNAVLRRLGVTSTTPRLLIVLACMTLPVVSNAALEPKPDLFAALLVVVAWMHASDYAARRHRNDLLWAFTCALIATCTKLVTVPFVAALAVGLVVCLGRRRLQAPSNNYAEPQPGGRVASLAVVVALLVTARTFMLAGIPTIGPDALFHLWQAFGFSLRFPAGSLHWTGAPTFADAGALAFDLLFAPQSLPNVLPYWTANLWLWAPLAILLVARAPHADVRPRDALHLSLFLAACALALMFGLSYGVRGSDGNYFISAVAPATLAGLAALWRRLPVAVWRGCVACLATFILLHTTQSLLSADWQCGTRAFDLDFRQPFTKFRKENRRLLTQRGLGEINTVLRHTPGHPRVVTCMDDNLSMRMEARTESVQQISYSRLDFYASESTFLAFLRDDDIRYLVVPNADHATAECYPIEAAQAAIRTLRTDPRVKQTHDASYDLLDLAEWARATR